MIDRLNQSQTTDEVCFFSHSKNFNNNNTKVIKFTISRLKHLKDVSCASCVVKILPRSLELNP